MKIEQIKPGEIERRSFEIIAEVLDREGVVLRKEQEAVIKRVIHTTADFDYAKNLVFSELAVQKGMDAIRNGACIVTDTQMAKAGINKRKLSEYGGEVYCFMSDEDVAAEAKEWEITRASVSMERAAAVKNPLIIAVGNAPTALLRLSELIQDGLIRPELIIGVPVGFVNVVVSKESIMQGTIPYIVAKGNKGGSGVAAAICNALLYQL